MLPDSAPVYSELTVYGSARPTIPHEDPLSLRFRSLGNPAASSTKSQDSGEHYRTPDGSLRNDEDDKSVDELLAELGTEQQWTADANNVQDVEKLLAEAQSAFSSTSDHVPEDDSAGSQSNPTPTEDKSSGQIDVSAFTVDNGSTNHESLREDQEAALSLQRILDELDLEEQARSSSPPNDDGDEREEPSSHPRTDDPHDPSTALDFPSPPTALLLPTNSPSHDSHRLIQSPIRTNILPCQKADESHPVRWDAGKESR